MQRLIAKAVLVAICAGLAILPSSGFAKGPPEIKPTTLPASPHTVKLPGAFEDVAVGGGGRYLIFYLKAQRQLALLDVNKAEMVEYIAVPADEILMTAGADKLIVVIPDQKLIQRWDLESRKRELTQTLFTSPVVTLSMGSASQGPILIAAGDSHQSQTKLFDLATLQDAGYEMPKQYRVGLGRSSVVRASADGTVFGAWRLGSSPSGLSAMVLSGKKAAQYYEHESVGYIVPSPDGQLLYTTRGIFTNQTNQVVAGNQDVRLIPALHGSYALGFPGGDLPREIRRRMAEARGEEFKPFEGPSIHVGADYEPLVTIPGVDIPEDGEHPMVSWRYRSPEKQLYFIPAAKLLVYLPPTNDRLVLYRVDLDELLRDAEREYLIVESSPPASAEPGESYRYAVRVRSSNAPATFQLESGPDGMVVSEQGVVSWDVPESAGGTTAQVILSVGDASEARQFHAFAVRVSGEPQEGTAAALAGAPGEAPQGGLAEPVDLKEIKPPQLAADHVEYRLPAAIRDLEWAGSGRFLLLHFADLNKLGVFDVNAAKIIHYLPANDDNFEFAAGATKLVAVAGDKRLLSRYDLATLKRELTVPLDVADPVLFAVMGHASEGPLMIGTKSHTYDSAIKLYDVASLKPLALETRGHRRTGSNMRVSAEGRVFGTWHTGLSPSGLNSLIFDGNNLEAHNQHTSVGHIRPSANGSILCTGRGLYTNRCVAMGSDELRQKSTLPSVTGYFFVVPDLDPHARTPQSCSLGIYMFGDSRRLFTVTDLPPVAEGIFARGNTSVAFDKRIHFHPEANLIVTVPPTADRLHLFRFDLKRAMEESGIDYLIVVSRPPTSANAGATLRYPLKVMSKKGGLTYQVEAGPEGMHFENGGTLVWDVADDAPPGKQSVILLVRDSAGQEVFHTFDLDVAGSTAREVTAAAPMPEPGVVAGAEPPAPRPSLPPPPPPPPPPDETPPADTRPDEAPPDKPPPATTQRPPRLAEPGGRAPRPETAAEPLRKWTDSSGHFSVDARFVKLAEGDGKVELERADGTRFSVPLQRLSAKDIVYAVKRHLENNGGT